LVFPTLVFNPRDREYKSYQESLRDRIIFEYLFTSKSRRWLDEHILGLDAHYSRGWQSFSILNYVGLTDKHKGFFKDLEINQALSFLLEMNDDQHKQIISSLTRYAQFLNTAPKNNLDWFTPPLNARKLIKNIGTSQYTDGVRIDKEFHDVFNPQNSPYYVERGNARKIRVLFNNKIFLADYRFENQEDRSIILQSIRFRKELKEEFRRVFPVPIGEFSIQQGKDLNHFIFTHSANIIEDTEEEDKGYPEGKMAFRTHRIFERDPKVIKKAKEKFSKEHCGHVFCEVCNFDFSEFYGVRGMDFIEGHHKKLVSEMKEGEETRIEDITLLCSNCHRMIHRKPLITVEELKLLINKSKR